MIKNVTQVVRYEQLKLENHFSEMLTATVSHEMRTPLNAIMSLLGNLYPYIKDPKGRKLVKAIQSSAKMLLFLVNDMLDIFQIKNGKFMKNEHEVNVRESIS